jgi:hypothetical protein
MDDREVNGTPLDRGNGPGSGRQVGAGEEEAEQAAATCAPPSSPC